MLSTQSVLRASAFTIAIVALSFGVFLSSSFFAPVAHAQTAPTCFIQPVYHANGNVVLSWSTTNAQSAQLSDGFGFVGINSSLSVGVVQAPKTYVLTAYSDVDGTGISTTCSTTVRQTYATNTATTTGFPACTLTIQPDYVFANGSAVITYNASGATSAYIDGGVGQVYGSGTKTIYNVTSPRTYTMTVSNNNGTTSCADTVSVAGSAPYYGGGTNYYNQQPYNYNYAYGNSYAYPTLGYQYPTNYPSYNAYANQNTYTTPTYYQKQTSAYYPTATRSVHIAAVPYTGPADTLYVAAMLALTLAIAFVLYRNRSVLRLA